MKTKIILTSVFAIMLFAVAANAQASIVRFNSHTPSTPVVLARSGETPTIDMTGSRPIKIVIDPVRTDRATPALLLSPSKGVTFKNVPCGTGEKVLVSNKPMQVYLEIELQNTLVSSYSISGHAGSCRLMSIRLSNGDEYRGRLRFRQ